MTRVLTVVGARPQFIKAASVSRALAAIGMEECLVHTGQHFDLNMSAVFFEELQLRRPDHLLEINGGGHGAMTGRMIVALEQVMLAERPDIVLIYGDTNSTLAGAITAAKLQIPIAHVEAGLRAYRPIPEEVNRIVSDRVSDLLFCPTQTAVANLAREGIVAGVLLVGDVMYDSVLRLREVAARRSTVLGRLGLEHGGYRLATIHRAENTDDAEALARVVAYLDEASENKPVILPLHPRTRHAAERFGLSFGKARIVEPVGYLDMLQLLDGCLDVFTDSGGIQKEACFFRRPCVTLRDATEWPETVESGWNRLWTVADYRPRREPTGFGDGHASDQIAGTLARHAAGTK
jgi:UDP-GlcNAc3NAcA epimerase